MPSVQSLMDEASIHRFINDASAPARTLLDDMAHWPSVHELVKRINITVYPSSDPGLLAAVQQDPWLQASKYAFGWVYFSMIALAIAFFVRLYYAWTDRIRRALHKEAALAAAKTPSPVSDYEMMNLAHNASSAHLFPRPPAPTAETMGTESSLVIAPINRIMALIRFFFYRPIPSIRLGKKTKIFLPPASALFFILAALIFVMLYCLLPQPLFYDSIRFGSPPLAIRAGMLAVALVPWIVALSMKANIITLITGIGHERLNVLHRWAGYLCLALGIVHTVPFYIQPIWDHGAQMTFQSFFSGQYYVYGTGIAALAPLGFLCVHSLPFVRAWMYELFVTLHLPGAIVFLAMMFWHCNNYLASWSFLWATVAIWLTSYVLRFIFFLNWTNFRRTSWLRGEEAAVTLLPENAVKITIPTQMKWRPGQHVYLRMPGISPLENHPFTIASLCSEDFPSEYGEQYRDLILVFRPFAGFTRKVVRAAQRHGPNHTYRAFLDGPYGGMQRELAAFESVVLIAGGSGITAIVSHLLALIKRMRDGGAVTKHVHVIWALKRPETAEWFKEELRICRQFAPLDSVHCQFYITAARRHGPNSLTTSKARSTGVAQSDKPKPFVDPFHHDSQIIHDKTAEAFGGIAGQRDSAIIRDEAAGDEEKARTLARENEDAIRPLPQVYFPPPLTRPARKSPGPLISVAIPRHPSTTTVSPLVVIPPPIGPLLSRTAPPPIQSAPTGNTTSPITPASSAPSFDFGFPSTPTLLQKNLMRFAFLPSSFGGPRSWSTEYGRPDIPFLIRELARTGGLGRRACVYVCGPPAMRVDVQTAVADLQRAVVGRGEIDEVFLHAENYAI